MLSCAGLPDALATANSHFEDRAWRRPLILLSDLAPHLARGEGMHPLWYSYSIHDSLCIAGTPPISS